MSDWSGDCSGDYSTDNVTKMRIPQFRKNRAEYRHIFGKVTVYSEDFCHFRQFSSVALTPVRTFAKIALTFHWKNLKRNGRKI